jgi:hypothetical protein
MEYRDCWQIVFYCFTNFLVIAFSPAILPIFTKMKPQPLIYLMPKGDNPFG